MIVLFKKRFLFLEKMIDKEVREKEDLNIGL